MTGITGRSENAVHRVTDSRKRRNQSELPLTNTDMMQAALSQLESAWKAFKVGHKIPDKPETKQSYGERYWSKEDHNSDSRKLNDKDRYHG